MDGQDDNVDIAWRETRATITIPPGTGLLTFANVTGLLHRAATTDNYHRDQEEAMEFTDSVSAFADYLPLLDGGVVTDDFSELTNSLLDQAEQHGLIETTIE